MAFFSLIINSSLFNGVFGDGGLIATTVRERMEYTYRHGRNGQAGYTTPNYTNYSDHDTYNLSGRSHFFGHADEYPK